jgi:hypothetical protein
MMYTLRLAFVAVFAAFATSAYAQNCNDPYMGPIYNFYQYPPGVTNASTFPDRMPCSGSADVNYTVTVNRDAWCDDANYSPPATYASNTLQVYGVGVAHCTINPLAPNVMCDPRFYDSNDVTTAVDSTDYNRFYLRAYDGYGGLWSACKSDVYSRQDFWQCAGVDCSSGGTGGDGCPPYCADGPSPIIIDVDNHGFDLTNAARGVVFDIFGTGHPIQMGWTAPGVNNAFLCLPDSNGKCDDGKDLFGNFTPQPPSKHPNGFAALAVYDDPKSGGNGDGVIDARDAIFSSLRLWIDANHDGVSQPEELHTLPSLGVNSISLTYKLSEKTDQYGNRFRYRAKVNPDDPDPSHVGRSAYDVFFVTTTVGTARNLRNPPGQKCTVPTSTKGWMLSTGRR